MRDLFTTIGTRYLIAILNLALIFINAKVLGVEGVGLVGLILAIVGIATMFCGILAGNTIVYFMNRYSMQAVFLPSYCRSWHRLRQHGHPRSASRRARS